jgi:sugar lactone lactonase YvrE
VGISIDGGGALHVWDAYGLGSLSGARVRRISALGFSQTLNLPFDPFFVGSGGPEVAPAADANGNLYFNGGEGTIRKLTGAGMITTVAGTPGTSGSADGTGSAASFSKGGAVAVDSAGNVYVADQWNSTIRKVTPAGVVTTIAGSPGVRGSSDGVGLAAFFNYPFGIAVDAAGNVFVADQWNHTIRRITPSGVVTTLAGVAGQPGGADGVGSAARFAAPSGLTIDAAGNLYVADRDNAAIRKITPAGVVVTVAGAAGQTGYADGSGNAARFDTPLGVTVDAAGNLFVADAGNSTIRRITPAGMVSTWAGAAPSAGSADGTGATANFRDPLGVAVASNGNVFIADWGNHTIRQITSAGVVTTLAGFALSPGSTDATGPAARFRNPGDIAVDSAGNLLVADAGNGLVRTVTTSGRVTTRLAREGAASVAVAPGGGFFLERILRTPANFLAMAFLPYSVFERIDAAGNANLLAGGLILPPNFAYRDGAGDQALIVAVGGVDYGRGNPSGVGLTSDAAGNLYFADSRNCAIRRIAPDGFVSTLAGGPPPLASCGNSDGIGTVARFDGPEGVALDGSGNIYVADTGNHTIRKIAPDGTVTTVLGVAGQSGIVLGASPGLSSPRRIAWLGGNRFLITSGNALLIATLP